MIASVQQRQRGPRLLPGCKVCLRQLNVDENLLFIYRWLNQRKRIKNIILILYAWDKSTNN